MTKLSSDLLQTTTFISNSLSFVLSAWKVARMTYFLKAEPQVYLVSLWTVNCIGE